jgi:preprotein translocase subunit SecE
VGSNPSWPGFGENKGIMINKTKNFISEVRTEMGKVTWSTREELMGSTAVVLMTMLILSTFIGVADFVFSHVLSIVLR